MPHPVPDTTPSPVNDRLRDIAERKAQLEAAKKTREAAAALPPSPEDALREAEEQLKRMEVEEADEVAWQRAQLTHGKGRVGWFKTPRGRVILRAMTAAESDAGSARLAAIEAIPMRIQVGRESVLNTVVPSGGHPTMEAVRATLAEYPGLWPDAYELRDALARGEAEALMGKA